MTIKKNLSTSDYRKRKHRKW